MSPIRLPALWYCVAGATVAAPVVALGRELELPPEFWWEVPCYSDLLTPTMIQQWNDEGCSISNFGWWRNDSDPVLADAGHPEWQASAVAHVINCPECCNTDCADVVGVLTDSKVFSFSQERTFEWTVGFEVGASIKAGVPIFAQGEIEVSLSSALGRGGATTHTLETSGSCEAPPCATAIIRFEVEVIEDAVMEITHQYRFKLILDQLLPGPNGGAPPDCQLAGQGWTTVLTCPQTRKSEAQSEDWRTLKTRTVNESAHACP